MANGVNFMDEGVLGRFLRYVRIDTQSREDQEDIPSTKKQFELAKLLVDELHGMGLKNASVDEHCYVMATLEGNTPCSHVVGFIAHMDTSPEASGKDVKPNIVKNYQGGGIVLPGEGKQIISAEELEQYIGSDIVTSDGTTLLGADDKCGIAEIMTAVSHMVHDPTIKHGTIKIGFTPDEEVGRGVDKFDVDSFGADVAYTIDGGEVGEIEDENFNAHRADLTIRGYNVHPGYAYNKMVNAIRIMGDFVSLLPRDKAPETTRNREGYLHPVGFSGGVNEVKLKILIRTFSDEETGTMKRTLANLVEKMEKRYPKAELELNISESYLNMKEQLDRCPIVMKNAVEAIKMAGIKPLRRPIRGGTDGSRLSFMGLPTPNVFAGGKNFHSVREFVPVSSMESAVEVILGIAGLYCEQIDET